jgi:magnesium-protoporphyrin O-methyltransferase
MTTYTTRRAELETYFDRTAVEAWAKLTTDAPVGRIRATVRAGRDEMRRTLLSWLPADLRGCRVLDAGCGTGSLAVEAARRGADVVAVDLSRNLIDLARQRLPAETGPGHVRFLAGDMLTCADGPFDHVVAMDSLIHYDGKDVVRALAGLARLATGSLVFTFVPRTPVLVAMHAVGRLFPKNDRAPAFQPLGESRLRALIADDTQLAPWRCGRTHHVARGFYISGAMELRR